MASSAERPSLSTAEIVAKHSGLGVLRRLLLLSKAEPSQAAAAVQAMEEYIKSQGTPNLTYYQHLTTQLGVQADSAWLAQVQADMEQNAVVLERQLNIATANQARDNIRVCHSPRLSLACIAHFAFVLHRQH